MIVMIIKLKKKRNDLSLIKKKDIWIKNCTFPPRLTESQCAQRVTWSLHHAHRSGRIDFTASQCACLRQSVPAPSQFQRNLRWFYLFIFICWIIQKLSEKERRINSSAFRLLWGGNNELFVCLKLNSHWLSHPKDAKFLLCLGPLLLRRQQWQAAVLHSGIIWVIEKPILTQIIEFQAWR